MAGGIGGWREWVCVDMDAGLRFGEGVMGVRVEKKQRVTRGTCKILKMEIMLSAIDEMVFTVAFARRWETCMIDYHV